MNVNNKPPSGLDGISQLELTEQSKILGTFEQRSFDASSAPSPSSVSNNEWQMIRDEELEDESNKTNLVMTAFNVINSIVGSGVIGMPYALKCSGIGMGLLVLVLVALVTDYSVNLIVMGGALSNTRTYQDLVRVAFGKPGHLLITVMQATYPFIAMISYNVIIGDTITKIVVRVAGKRFAHSILADRNFIVFLATIIILLPLSFFKNIGKLSKTSLLSTAIICLVVVTMGIRSQAYASKVLSSTYEWTFANKDLPQSIGIMAFAFMCQHNTYLCFESLKKRSLERWALVVHLAVGGSLLISSLLGLVGYATFTGTTQGDVLENYCADDDLMNMSRFLFAVTIMLTYPMECFVVREVLENYFFPGGQPPPMWRHILLTTAIVVLSFFASMLTACVSIVLEINGVFTAAPLAFIIPPLCVMRLQNEPFFRILNIPLLLITAFGSLVALSGAIMIVLDLANGIKCSQGHELYYCSSNFSLPTSSPRPES